MANLTKSIIAFVCVILVLQSCADKQLDSACECGSSGQHFENVGGVVVKSRSGEFVIISDQLGFVLPCSGMGNELKVDGTLVSFSGSYVHSCTKVEKGYGVNVTKTVISSISKADNLYTDSPLIIKIIHTEDYGNPPGFGYEISYTKIENFVIRQLDIPGTGNNQPFKSANDAFKVAVLVGYKLELINGFPTIQQGELFYLHIIDQLI